MTKRNSFGHWETDLDKRHTWCIVCHKYGYDEMCKDCKRPKYIVVHSAEDFNCVSQEGYQLLEYKVVSYLKKIDKLEDGPVSDFKEFYLLELKDLSKHKSK